MTRACICADYFEYLHSQQLPILNLEHVGQAHGHRARWRVNPVRLTFRTAQTLEASADQALLDTNQSRQSQYPPAKMVVRWEVCLPLSHSLQSRRLQLPHRLSYRQTYHETAKHHARPTHTDPPQNQRPKSQMAARPPRRRPSVARRPLRTSATDRSCQKRAWVDRRRRARVPQMLEVSLLFRVPKQLEDDRLTGATQEATAAVNKMREKTWAAVRRTEGKSRDMAGRRRWILRSVDDRMTNSEELSRRRRGSIQ